MIVPAYLESGVIAGKVEDIHRNGYPGELELVVVAEDRETADEARHAGSRVLQANERLGKAKAINTGVSATTNPVIVITDADTRLEPGALASLARWFADPGVGAVAGEKRVRDRGQALYWRYESWLKRNESICGTTVALVGELTAVRRSLFSPIPSDVIVDDLWIGLDVIEGGARIPYEPAAVAWEPPTPGLRAEWERRTRTTAGLLDALSRRRAMLIPGRDAAPQLWGHKLMRLMVGPLAHFLLLVQAIRSGRSNCARAFLLGHLLAIAAIVRQGRNVQVTQVERAAAQATFLQATAVGGFVRYFTGDRPAQWPKVDRSRGDQ